TKPVARSISALQHNADGPPSRSRCTPICHHFGARLRTTFRARVGPRIWSVQSLRSFSNIAIGARIRCSLGQRDLWSKPHGFTVAGQKVHERKSRFPNQNDSLASTRVFKIQLARVDEGERAARGDADRDAGAKTKKDKERQRKTKKDKERQRKTK